MPDERLLCAPCRAEGPAEISPGLPARLGRTGELRVPWYLLSPQGLEQLLAHRSCSIHVFNKSVTETYLCFLSFSIYLVFL